MSKSLHKFMVFADNGKSAPQKKNWSGKCSQGCFIDFFIFQQAMVFVEENCEMNMSFHRSGLVNYELWITC